MEDLTVDLPAGTDVCDIATLTIWSEPFRVFFSRIDVPASLFVSYIRMTLELCLH